MPGYAPRLIWDEAPAGDVGVVFHRVPVQSNGSPGVVRYWDHAASTWSALFDPARHVRRLARPLSALGSAASCFAVPIDLTADPLVSASVYILKADGSPGQLWRTWPNIHLIHTAAGGAGYAV